MRNLGQRSSLLGLFAVVALCCAATTAWGLTKEEIDAAIQRGQMANAAKEAPTWIKAGVKFPKGDFWRTAMLGVSQSPYYFYVQTCEQFVSGEVLRAKLDAKEIDRAHLDEKCLGRDPLAVSVSTSDLANAVNLSFGYVPVSSPGITAVQLEVDGQLLQSSGGDVFEDPRIRTAKALAIVATVDSRYQLKVPLSSSVKKKLFPEPERKKRRP